MNTRILSDDDILKAYYTGWDHENDIAFKLRQPNIYHTSLLQRAYDLGRSDYVLGDDFEELDYQTKEEILNNIKNDRLK